MLKRPHKDFNIFMLSARVGASVGAGSGRWSRPRLARWVLGNVDPGVFRITVPSYKRAVLSRITASINLIRLHTGDSPRSRFHDAAGIYNAMQSGGVACVMF